MREAVIVSTARTPIGRAYRGAPTDAFARLGYDAVSAVALRIAAGSGPCRPRAL